MINEFLALGDNYLQLMKQVSCFQRSKIDYTNMDKNLANSASNDNMRRIGCDERSHHHPEKLLSSFHQQSSSSSQNETQPLLYPIPSTSHQNSTSVYTFLSHYSQGFQQEGIKMLKITGDKKDKKETIEKSEIDGCHAFLTLAFIFIINANSLASLKIYGIIFERIVADKYYTREQAAWPISTASTVQNLAGLLTPILSSKISWRSIELIQASLFVLANVGAYFSDTLAMDIIYLGIIQGVAFSIRYNMNVVINNEYFQKYRATAMGISLAGSSCGVFFLKPYVAYVLDTSGPNQFRNAYLALAIVMSINFILGLFIRKPKTISNNFDDGQRNMSLNDNLDEDSSEDPDLVQENGDLSRLIIELLKNPSIHCIWIMQTIYFYISRTYTIFVVDFGVNKGFDKNSSRNLLTSWAIGEVGGRFLLGGFVDYRLLNVKWNIIIVNLLLAVSGFALLLDCSHFDKDNQSASMQNQSIVLNINATKVLNMHPKQIQSQDVYFWYLSSAIAMGAALSSLLNIMIVPFCQEYLGKKNVPWAFALGSVVTSVFLLFRPLLIGLSKDSNENPYYLLIVVMSSAPLIYGFLFLFAEPSLKRFRYRRASIVDQ